jgi:hypothetical protein
MALYFFGVGASLLACSSCARLAATNGAFDVRATQAHGDQRAHHAHAHLLLASRRPIGDKPSGECTRRDVGVR